MRSRRTGLIGSLIGGSRIGGSSFTEGLMLSENLRGCFVVQSGYRLSYAALHEHQLSKQPLRGRVGLPATIPAAPSTASKTAPPLPAQYLRRRLLYAAHGLRLALSPLQLPSLADGVLPLQAFPPQRYLAFAVYGPASSRTRARPSWTARASRRSRSRPASAGMTPTNA